MELHYWFLGPENEVLFSNQGVPLPNLPELRKGMGRGVVQIDGKDYRYGRIHGQGGFIVALAVEPAEMNIFNEKFDVLKDFLSHLQTIKDHIIDDTLHNLTAIHAHSVFEIFNVIPEEFIFRDFTRQVDDVKQQIVSDLPGFALATIQIIRNNKIMKAEFDNIRLLHTSQIKPKFRPENVSKVIQSVLYLYFQDFARKSIRVKNDFSDDMVNIDYALFIGALIPVFENFVKYIEPGTTLRIEYIKQKGAFTVRFTMSSYTFSEDERERIFEKKYSGTVVRGLKKAGKGLGLYQAKKILNIIRAKIDLYPKPDSKVENSFRENVLDITFVNS